MRPPCAGILFGCVLGGLALGACQPDPCAELVDKTCGEDEVCAVGAGCRNARELLEADVESACREALANPIGYPECANR